MKNPDADVPSQPISPRNSYSLGTKLIVYIPKRNPIALPNKTNSGPVRIKKMIFLNQIIPGLSSIVILFLLELILKRPESIYYFGPVCLALIILAVRQLCRRRLKSKKSWQIVLTPVLFFLGGLFFLIFLEENFLRQFFLLSLVAILWLYLKVVYLRFHLKTKYQLHSFHHQISF